MKTDFTEPEDWTHSGIDSRIVNGLLQVGLLRVLDSKKYSSKF